MAGWSSASSGQVPLPPPECRLDFRIAPPWWGGHPARRPAPPRSASPVESGAKVGRGSQQIVKFLMPQDRVLGLRVKFFSTQTPVLGPRVKFFSAQSPVLGPRVKF